MYLLDTNIISYWMRGDQRIIEKIKSCSPTELSFSTITLAEIYYGIKKSPVKKKDRRKKLSSLNPSSRFILINERAAVKYGVIRARLEKNGQPIGERGLQIAAIAAANRLCVVTHNTKEFGRVAKLKVEDWASV